MLSVRAQPPPFPLARAGRLCKKLAPERLLLGRRPLPALLFLIAEKEGKKASTPGTYKTYFEPGILQPFILGAAPQTRLTFFIAKKTLRAAFAKS